MNETHSTIWPDYKFDKDPLPTPKPLCSIAFPQTKIQEDRIHAEIQTKLLCPARYLYKDRYSFQDRFTNGKFEELSCIDDTICNLQSCNMRPYRCGAISREIMKHHVLP